MPGTLEGLFGDVNTQREEGNCWLGQGHVSSMPPSIDGSGSTAQNWLLLACDYAPSSPLAGGHLQGGFEMGLGHCEQQMYVTVGGLGF